LELWFLRVGKCTVVSRFSVLALLLVALAASNVLTQTPATVSRPEAAPLANLRVPPGFEIAVFASNLQGARLMALSPEGVLLVARRRTNEVVALPDGDNDGVAEPVVLLTGLANAHSLAFKDGYLYIATTPAIMRVKWAGGRPSGEPELFAELPNSTPSLHVSRTIRAGRDGRLYVSIGSSCNVCLEPDPRRTTIQVFTNGAKLEPYAMGLRNAIGFDWDPATGRMWATDVGQDGNGSDYPPDEINMVEAGRHYGYPFFVGNNLPNDVPELKSVPPTVTAKDAVPVAFPLPPHITPIDLRYYSGTQFPPEYRGAMFVSLHGSSTIPEKIGYKVVRIVMKDGRPAGFEDFATGWLNDGVVSGRPAGLITGADGALYISDDNKGFVYRISYRGQ
jgi:glucose/arabinose dehydrogenase